MRLSRLIIKRLAARLAGAGRFAQAGVTTFRDIIVFMIALLENRVRKKDARIFRVFCDVTMKFPDKFHGAGNAAARRSHLSLPGKFQGASRKKRQSAG
jgi:hypothetical protein